MDWAWRWNPHIDDPWAETEVDRRDITALGYTYA
jgi:hypothetical protein